MPTPTAKPIISPVQSVLGFLQWQAFEFLPSAVNFPTKWYCSAMPPGLFFDEDTGAIFGAVIIPGVFDFVLYAENAIGLSDAQAFTLGIEASGNIVPASILDLSIDIVTRRVSVAGLVTDEGRNGATANSAGKSDEPLEALFWVKAGDDLIINVRFTKGGVQFDPNLTGLKFALKEFEPEEPILSSGGGMLKVGSGDGASFRLYVQVDDEPIRSALSNYEEDTSTQLLALGEFEWTQQNTSGVGPSVIRGSSRTFGVMLVRDIIANP